MRGIPKTIHQIWLGPKPAPKQWMSTWPKMNPDWEYRLWSEENLPDLINQAAFQKAYCYPSKADVLRLEILYRFGGIYVDADSICLKPLDGLLGEVDAPMFCAYENDSDPSNKLLGNSVIGSVPANEDVRTLLENMEPDRSLPAWKSTGPEYFTRMLEEHEMEVQVFPSSYFYPWHFTDLENSPLLSRGKNLENSYCFQYWGSTFGAYGKSELRNRLNWLFHRPCWRWLQRFFWWNREP